MPSAYWIYMILLELQLTNIQLTSAEIKLTLIELQLEKV